MIRALQMLPHALSATFAAGMLLCLSTGAAQAALATDDTGSPKIWISTPLGSYHVRPVFDYNERNRGLGLEYHQGRDVLYMVGTYRNSAYDRSIYGLVGWTPLHVGPFAFGAVAGLVNGYPELNNGGIGPIASALIRLEGKGAWRNFGANLIIAPPVPQKQSPLTFGLQVKFGF